MSSLITTVVLVSAFGLVALRPWMPRHSTPYNLQFALGFLINEQPVLAFLWLASGTVPTIVGGGVGTVGWLLMLGVTAVPAAILTTLAVRTRSARPALEAALRTEIGDHCPPAASPTRSRTPLIRVLLVPFISYRPDVRRFRSRRYGDARRGNVLDVYVRRRGVEGAPVLIYLHGGGFRMGSKMLGARPLLYRLASEGWVCVSANYRLGRRATYRERLTDVKRVICWIREHAATYGADPATVVLAADRRVPTWRRPPRSRPATPVSSPASRERTRRRQQSSGCTGTTARRRATRTSRAHRTRSSTPTPRRSSSSMGRSTRWCSSRTLAASRANCAPLPTSPSSTPSCRGPSTTSTCSTRCGSTP
jgi:hypothetical protein